MTLTKFVVENVLPLLGAIMGAVAPLVVLEFKKYVAAKTKNEQLRGLYDRLADAAADVVRDVSATTYKTLVSVADDGKISAADRNLLREAGVSRLKAVAASEIGKLQDLQKLAADQMLLLLQAKIERAVDEMKLVREAAKNATPVAPVVTGA